MASLKKASSKDGPGAGYSAYVAKKQVCFTSPHVIRELKQAKKDKIYEIVLTIVYHTRIIRVLLNQE